MGINKWGIFEGAALNQRIKGPNNGGGIELKGDLKGVSHLLSLSNGEVCVCVTRMVLSVARSRASRILEGTAVQRLQDRKK